MSAIVQLIAVILVAIAVATPAAAHRHGSAQAAVQVAQAVPLDQVLGSVLRQCPGQFLDASLRQSGGRSVYVIKILRPGGRVVYLEVDAQSGAIVRGRC
jgi:uncharacterized membrane protein YkoI